MTAPLHIPAVWTFDSPAVARNFDEHVREQLPWYDLATAAVASIARQYLSEGGLVYDLGAATGNIGRAVADLLHDRQADLVGIEKSATMARQYDGPGQVVVSSVEDYLPQPYDVGISFLTLMFIAPHRLDDLLDRWLGALRPGGVFIAVERTTPPAGYPAAVFSRLTWQAKRAAGATGDDIIAKELSLSGVQRPLDAKRLTDRGGVEFFRYADFAGYIVERP